MGWDKAQEDWAEDFSKRATTMLDLYCRTLTDLGYEPVPYPDIEEHLGSSPFTGGKYAALNHANWMCAESRRFIAQNRRAKAYRWIGMIQGILWLGGVFSIAELRRHNELPPDEWSPRRRGSRPSGEDLLKPTD